ncbi:hypothetical protein H1Q63_32825 [Desmonostoc muscorum CCALA 125]|nr:hypothetical protein [Desmonostoc muscorum CCALA 125]
MARQGKTPDKLPNGNGQLSNFFPYCHNCRQMEQNKSCEWGVGSGEWGDGGDEGDEGVLS